MLPFSHAVSPSILSGPRILVVFYFTTSTFTNVTAALEGAYEGEVVTDASRGPMSAALRRRDGGKVEHFLDSRQRGLVPMPHRTGAKPGGSDLIAPGEPRLIPRQLTLHMNDN